MVTEESSFGEAFGARRHLFALLIDVAPLWDTPLVRAPPYNWVFPRIIPQKSSFPQGFYSYILGILYRSHPDPTHMAALFSQSQ